MLMAGDLGRKVVDTERRGGDKIHGGGFGTLSMKAPKSTVQGGVANETKEPNFSRNTKGVHETCNGLQRTHGKLKKTKNQNGNDVVARTREGR